MSADRFMLALLAVAALSVLIGSMPWLIDLLKKSKEKPALSRRSPFPEEDWQIWPEHD